VLNEECISLAERIGEALVAKQAHLAVAETTAGGLISAHCVAVPGASRWFDRGVVAYAGTSKQDSLGADADILKEHGAVSPQAVASMAEGLRKMTGADYVVAESGLAGPVQRRSLKGIGTVTFALATPEGTQTEQRRFDGSRMEVMEQIVWHALATIAQDLGLSAEHS
jgi:PncC family amidohydrolase